MPHAQLVTEYGLVSLFLLSFCASTLLVVSAKGLRDIRVPLLTPQSTKAIA